MAAVPIEKLPRFFRSFEKNLVRPRPVQSVVIDPWMEKDMLPAIVKNLVKYRRPVLPPEEEMHFSESIRYRRLHGGTGGEIYSAHPRARWVIPSLELGRRGYVARRRAIVFWKPTGEKRIRKRVRPARPRPFIFPALYEKLDKLVDRFKEHVELAFREATW